MKLWYTFKGEDLMRRVGNRVRSGQLPAQGPAIEAKATLLVSEAKDLAQALGVPVKDALGLVAAYAIEGCQE